ncbi:MAG: hypothetical protein FJ267_08480, partial [Planctomycetes bacterium]|nr:hypothetical protein [Planctomycetota bacterium]
MSTFDLPSPGNDGSGNDQSPEIGTSPNNSQHVRLRDRSEILGVLKFLYNHNPFYPISAVLILLGL